MILDIEQTITDLNIKAMKYNLKINFKSDKILLNIKPNKIKEVLINVLDNAIKYSLKDSIINVISYAQNYMYNIEITNFTEAPIPYEIYNHIFEPFIKSNLLKDEYSTGLGLYLCNEIIKDHNGSITLKNGKEIQVIITLPLVNKNILI